MPRLQLQPLYPVEQQSKWAARYWQRFLHSRYAPLLTHGSLATITCLHFALLLYGSLWLALPACAILEHRIGILIHEYIHGIPFRQRRYNRWVVTFYDGLMLGFGLLELFRTTHLAHHRWLNAEGDPAYQSAAGAQVRPGALGALWSLELSQLLLYFRAALRTRAIRIELHRVLLGAALSIAWVTYWSMTGRWWMWPLLHGLIIFTAAIPSSLRGAVEHHSYPGDPSFANEYRPILPLFNLNRHIHHHLEPACPWYRLRFVTDHPLPARRFFLHWVEVYVRRRYVLMRPMGTKRSASARLPP